MPTPLTISICLILTLAAIAGAFYWGYKVGIIDKTSSDNQTRINLSVKQIEEMAEVIEQLQYQLEHDRRGMDIQTPKQTVWDPANPLNTPERR